MFKKILNGLKLFGGLLPVLKAFMEFIEVPGAGEKKKAATLEFIGKLWQYADKKVNDKLPDWNPEGETITVKSLFSTVIDLGIKVWNFVGKFTHKEE